MMTLLNYSRATHEPADVRAANGPLVILKPDSSQAS